jgi:hypothetical protein
MLGYSQQASSPQIQQLPSPQFRQDTTGVMNVARHEQSNIIMEHDEEVVVGMTPWQSKNKAHPTRLNKKKKFIG